MDSYQIVTAASVNVIITSNVTSHVVEKRFAKQVTIGEIKVIYLFISTVFLSFYKNICMTFSIKRGNWN